MIRRRLLLLLALATLACGRPRLAVLLDGRGPWRWLALRTLPLHRAIPLVLQALEALGPERMLVLVEDARLVKHGTRGELEGDDSETKRYEQRNYQQVVITYTFGLHLVR